MKKFLVFLTSIAAAAAIVLGFQALRQSGAAVQEESVSKGKITQKVLSVLKVPHTIHRVYDAGSLVGVLSDEGKLNAHLERVYQEEYEDAYPDSALHPARSVLITDEQSFLTYEDRDEEIIRYIEDKDLYTLSCWDVEFTDAEGNVSGIFVNDRRLYIQAMRRFMAMFLEDGSLDDLMKGETPPDLADYGVQETGISVQESVTYRKTSAPPAEIYTDEDEILEWLKYGSGVEKQYVTVQEGDTLAGIAARVGLSVDQLFLINQDRLESEEADLTAGTQLNITYFNSPVHVVVSREHLSAEPIPFATQYVTDGTIDPNASEVRQTGQNGVRSALYQEKWVNGMLEGSELISSRDRTDSVSEVIAVGVNQRYGVGTGSLRLPVDHASPRYVPGQNGIDYVNAYDSWGSVFAADHGIVAASGSDETDGYWIRLDHQNGTYTYYAHLRDPAGLPNGTVVSRGTVIGSIGMSGQSAYPHVLFRYEDENGNTIRLCTDTAVHACREGG